VILVYALPCSLILFASSKDNPFDTPTQYVYQEFITLRENSVETHLAHVKVSKLNVTNNLLFQKANANCQRPGKTIQISDMALHVASQRSKEDDSLPNKDTKLTV
jgi:hypothetical protein